VYFVVNSSAICLVHRYIQTQQLDIREMNLMFHRSVILPTAMT
jgi:hypothetical protein